MKISLDRNLVFEPPFLYARTPPPQEEYKTGCSHCAFSGAVSCRPQLLHECRVKLDAEHRLGYFVRRRERP